MNELASNIQTIVDAEAPIHVDQVVVRITTGAGLQRAGNRIRSAVDRAIKQVVWNKQAVKRSKFLYKPDGKVIVRDRSDFSQQEKKLEYIASEEILAALAVVVQGAFRIPTEEAISRACRLLGFRRISSAMIKSVKKLVKGKNDLSGIRITGNDLVWQDGSA